MDTNPMELFQKEAPEVAAAFNNLIQTLVASRGLDQKTKQLIYIAMKASTWRRYGSQGACSYGQSCWCDQGRGG